MRLSDLVDRYGDRDPIIAILGPDGIPADPADIEEGVIALDGGLYPYIALELPSE